jgi:hypothetical protein
MNYSDFKDFIENRMRMSHVYQPVMLMTLLRGGGKASTPNSGRHPVFRRVERGIYKYVGPNATSLP